MAEIDAELAQALKLAKGKKMFFAFIPKGADGKLIISKAKILPKQIAEARKEISGGAPVTGKCFGPISSMVFQVAKEPSPMLGAALKKVVHRDAGLTIVPDVQLAADADADEEATGAAAAGAVATAGGAAAGAGLAEFTTRLKALMPAIQQAQTNAAAPDAQQVKAWAAEAGALAAKHDLPQAHAVLDKVESAVKAGPAAAAPGADPDMERQIAYTKAQIDSKITALEKHPQHAQIDKQIQALKTRAADTLKLAQPPQRKYREALNALDRINGACDVLDLEVGQLEHSAKLKRDLDAIDMEKVLKRKADVDEKIAGLEKHPEHAHIAKDIQDLKTRAAQAVQLARTAPQEKSKDAVEALNKIWLACFDAETKANLYAEMVSGEGSTDRLAKILDRDPDKAKLFDQMIEGLDDSTPQVIFEAAIRARFGVAVSQYEHKKTGKNVDIKDVSGAVAVNVTLPDKSLRRMYELLAKVPAGHAVHNPRLQQIVRFTEDKGGGLYSGGKVYLYCGRADNTQPYQLAKPGELPTVDDDCKPKPGEPPPDYFDFATLHEVGHAVDDKKGFMDDHMSSPLYGGWEKTDIDKLAKVAAKWSGFDEDYINSRLSDKKPDPPKRPDDKTAKEWQAAKDKADKWCDGIRVKKGLWWDGANSIALAIDGMVYQEAYDGQWWRYMLDARKKGISGYQFRAPGEWFAELYAAYESGKLKDSHPAMSWLKTL